MLVIFPVLLVTVVTGVGYLALNSEKITNYFAQYHRTSEKKLIRFLEERYDYTFPLSMINVKAGELYTGIDGSSMYILKFQISSKELDIFMMQFDKSAENLRAYASEADRRTGDEYPERFKTPIEKGLIGNSAVPYIYIDTGNQNESIIYMEGVYKM